MAIDPSIIGNVMAPAATQLPDVNAMMQTRTAGLENVYKIEQQRAEQQPAQPGHRPEPRGQAAQRCNHAAVQGPRR